jgi:S-adenosylmethionine/arginine decarboxylase-like enzyme
MYQHKSGRMVKFICEGCSISLLSDRTFLESMLLSTCKILQMTPLSGPFYGEVSGEGSDDGISLVIIIKESHIAAHAWHKCKAIRIVVDSCKDFECEEIIKYFFEYLKPSNILIYQEDLTHNLKSGEYYFN